MSPFTYSSSSTSPSELFQDFLGNVHSRRLLLHTPLHQFPATVALPGTGNGQDSVKPSVGENSFDANVVMILSVLLCALICALGLNSIVRCALRCSSRVAAQSGNNSSARRVNTGISRKILQTFITLTYSDGLALPGLDSECVICLSEFAHGEHIKNPKPDQQAQYLYKWIRPPKPKKNLINDYDHLSDFFINHSPDIFRATKLPGDRMVRHLLAGRDLSLPMNITMSASFANSFAATYVPKTVVSAEEPKDRDVNSHINNEEEGLRICQHKTSNQSTVPCSVCVHYHRLGSS
ncbi:hypothetical protein HHK36_004201 [Tetracentron sinense]|uniref:Uncharacterized protein n=1 Tax=Tetracentron sinense TaxID=13715 RepID=A0A835DP92_TETSI|nr:hypothetical protein HHK36_004201 [Tetracentron sinense]